MPTAQMLVFGLILANVMGSKWNTVIIINWYIYKLPLTYNGGRGGTLVGYSFAQERRHRVSRSGMQDWKADVLHGRPLPF